MLAKGLASSSMPWLHRESLVLRWTLGKLGEQNRKCPAPPPVRKSRIMEAGGEKEPGSFYKLPGGECLSKEAKSKQAGQVIGCGRVRVQGSHCRFDAGLGAKSQGQPSISARSLGSADGGFSVGD